MDNSGYDLILTSNFFDFYIFFKTLKLNPTGASALT